jgi:hypothetical protein
MAEIEKKIAKIPIKNIDFDPIREHANKRLAFLSSCFVMASHVF